jgi:hypothetical protein
MRPLPRASYPVEFVTLDIDVEEAMPKGPTLKVLLLEDRDDFREVLHEYVVSRCYQVTSVWSGVEACVRS